MKYRHKPTVVEARQLPFLGEEPEGFLAWAEQVGFSNFLSDRDGGLVIPTTEGDMRADPGDWIVRDVLGNFYPCKPDVFASSYDPDDALAAVGLGAKAGGRK
jgi:hypothetical protein